MLLVQCLDFSPAKADRHFRMDQADASAIAERQGHGQRQAIDQPAQHAQRLLGNLLAPLAAVAVPEQGRHYAAHRILEHRLVIASERVEPWQLLDPQQQVETVRAAVDQVAERDQAIAGAVELDGMQKAVEQRGMTVHIADDEIAAVQVHRQRMEGRVDQHGSAVRERESRFISGKVGGCRGAVFGRRTLSLPTTLREAVRLDRSAKTRLPVCAGSRPVGEGGAGADVAQRCGEARKVRAIALANETRAVHDDHPAQHFGDIVGRTGSA